jgi:hypothetical protein
MPMMMMKLMMGLKGLEKIQIEMLWRWVLMVFLQLLMLMDRCQIEPGL